jgi:hypothetical protein
VMVGHPLDLPLLGESLFPVHYSLITDY